MPSESSSLRFARSVTSKPVKYKFQLLLLSQPDHCNSLLIDLPSFLLQKLEKAQKIASPIVFCRQKALHAIPFLHKAHCATIVFKALPQNTCLSHWHLTTQVSLVGLLVLPFSLCHVSGVRNAADVPFLSFWAPVFNSLSVFWSCVYFKASKSSLFIKISFIIEYFSHSLVYHFHSRLPCCHLFSYAYVSCMVDCWFVLQHLAYLHTKCTFLQIQLLLTLNSAGIICSPIRC